MHQSSTPNLQRPQPDMKKKIIIALMAVAVGHMGVLWGVSHLKTPELTPIEKKPIKVRLVTIKEEFVPPPPPPPPPPIQPIKPKVEPKPEPIPVVKPKVIAQKPEKTKEKVIHQDDTLDKQKLEKDRLEKDRQKREQDERDRQKREQDERDRQKREKDESDRQKREQDERDRQNKEREANANKPRKLTEGDVSWSRKPQINPDMLKRLMKIDKDVAFVNGAKSVTQSISLRVSSDGNGNVSSVKLLQSTGNTELDNYVIQQTQKGKFKPFKENGVSVPFVIDQSLRLANTVKR